MLELKEQKEKERQAKIQRLKEQKEKERAEKLQKKREREEKIKKLKESQQQQGIHPVKAKEPTEDKKPVKQNWKKNVLPLTLPRSPHFATNSYATALLSFQT